MSEFISNFHFIRPWWLLCAAPAVLLYILLLHRQKKSIEWQSLIAPHLLPFLLEGKNTPASKIPPLVLLIIWLIAGLALAGPSWEKIAQPVHKDSSALVILFDLSPSMNVADVAPSRLVRARLKVIDLLNTRVEGLTALVAYAGESHVVTPLTDDVATIKNLIPSLSPDTMPVRGSNPEMALEQANKLLSDAGILKGNILFVTDGIEPFANKRLGEIHRANPHRVSIWGFGTDEGAPIPLPDRGFARNRKGDIVVAKLNSEELSDAAVNLEGIYIPFTDNNRDIESINSFGLDSSKNLDQKSTREFDQWVEFGPWLLLLILPFAALSFRRGVILSFLLASGFLGPNKSFADIPDSPDPLYSADSQATPASAKSTNSAWKNLWLTPDQQGQRALDDGDTARAMELFNDAKRKAVAAYRNEDFDKAAEYFSDEDQSDSDKADNERVENYYNQGTALTHAGKYDAAIEAFDKSLELEPDFDQARNNRKIAEALKKLEEQQQEENSQNQDQGQDQNQQEDQQKGDQSKSEQQNQDQNQEQQSEQQGQSANKDDPSDEQEQAQNDAQEKQDGENEEQEQAEQEAMEEYRKKMREAEQQASQDQNNTQEAGEEEKNDSNEKDQAYALSEAERQEKSEEEQSLEQWLRKVPDDPSRLLRNKFRYEAQQRQLDFRNGRWNPPENDATERW